ncbi:MAG: class I tRNA ligase family protein [bacterium]|nr:class I tRNA ligase family protein [bacterium]
MISFPELEEGVLARWRENKTFEKSLERRKGVEPFVFFEGPPTANGRPGIHHVLARAFKDIICRYKTMAGFFVSRKAGWDTHGLPVELEVEKQLGLKSKKDIEQYGIAAFNKKCKESVWTYKDEWEKLTDRMGFWLDMARPYITYDPKYMETLWWVIRRIWERRDEKGNRFLYQGHKVVPYCARCGTGLSSHEVAQGYKNISENSVYVKFKVTEGNDEKIKTGNVYILVWTTTPWTLPANLALAVGENILYAHVYVKETKEHFYVAKDRLSALPEGSFDIKDTRAGKGLIGWKYEPLYGTLKEKNENAYKIYTADFVSTADGTGVVHIAPMYGEDDYNLGKEHNLPNLHTVELDGTVKKGLGIPGEGKFVKDADKDITADLKEREILFKEEACAHDYPFCWRCDRPLLYYAKPSWFISMSRVREKLIENNNYITWVPEHMKEGRFGEWLKEVKDWNFSRERYWGTPLPIWKCEACGKEECIGSLEELDARAYKKSGNTYYASRHGEAEFNCLNRMSDKVEDQNHLTQEGRRQVFVAAEKLKKSGIDLIFSSDLLRTKETAETIGEALGIKVSFDERLREIRVGDFGGKPAAEYHEYFASRSLNRFDTAVEGGETWADLRGRMMAFWMELEEKHQGKNILIVSHGDPLWVLERTLSGFGDDDFRQVGTQPTGREEYPTYAEPRKIFYGTMPRDEEGSVNLHRPYVDEFYLCCRCGKKMTRVKELIDVWFDSGSMPFAQGHYPFEHKDDIDSGKTFPAEYISEAIDQTRGWFYTLLAVSTLLDKGAPYKNVISLSHVLDAKGQKMSKSKGNVVSPWDIISKYGVDALRWYFFTANDPGDYKLFDEKHVEERMRGFLGTLWNCAVFYKTYERGQKANEQEEVAEHKLDKWILSKLGILVQVVRLEKLDSYDVTGAARAIERFVVDDLSQWYVRRSRERLQENKVSMAAFRKVLETVSCLAAPFIPFVADAIWQELGNKESVHLADYPSGPIIKEDELNLIREMEIVRIVVAKGLEKRAEAKIKIRQSLTRYTTSTDLLSVYGIKNLDAGFLDILKEELNVKEIVFGEKEELDTLITPELQAEGDARELMRKIQDARRKAGLKPGERIELVVGDEKEKKILESDLGIAVKNKTSTVTVKFNLGSELAIMRDTSSHARIEI